MGTAFPHFFHVLFQSEFEAVLKSVVFWERSHTFFVSTTSLIAGRTKHLRRLHAACEPRFEAWFMLCVKKHE